MYVYELLWMEKLLIVMLLVLVLVGGFVTGFVYGVHFRDRWWYRLLASKAQDKGR